MATENDAYCLKADVEARVGRGAFSASTRPTEAEVLRFMETRASEIYGILRECGQKYTPPAGDTPFGNPSDYLTKSLKNMCSLANELAAAGDAVAVHNTTAPDGRPPEAIALWEEAERVRSSIVSFCQTSFGGAETSSHTATGGIGKGDYGSDPTSERATSELWGLDTKW